MEKCAVYDAFIMLICLAGQREMRQRIYAAICPKELLAFEIDTNGEDE